MFPEVQKSVREWTFTLSSELPFWELESRWTPEFSEGNCRSQIHWIKNFLISLERFWNVDVWNGLTWLIWTPETQKKGRESNWQFDSQPLKVWNRLDFLMCRWRAIYYWNLLIKATTLLQTSYQSEVCTQSYWSSKSREFQVWEFQGSHLGVPGQNAIWMWASWRDTKYTIRGKVVVSPKSRPWWVLWVRIC